MSDEIETTWPVTPTSEPPAGASYHPLNTLEGFVPGSGSVTFPSSHWAYSLVVPEEERRFLTVARLPYDDPAPSARRFHDFQFQVHVNRFVPAEPPCASQVIA